MATDYTQYLANRKLNIAERRQQNLQKSQQQEVLAAQQKQAQLEKEAADAHWLKRIGETIADVGVNVLSGLGKGLEGIVDLGAGVVGAVGGIFDGDFQDDVKGFISKDYVGNSFLNSWNEGLNASYLKDGGFVEQVSQGVGQMLPAVAITAATLGAGAPVAAASLAGGAYMGASAAGGGTEEAFNDGADYYKGFGYGLVQGGIEMVIESISSALGVGLKGLVKPGTKTVAGAGRKILGQMASEALEEGFTEAINPITKTIYKGREALDEYYSPDFKGNVLNAALVGGTVGGIMQGGSYAVQGVKNRSVGGLKGVSVSESVSEINTLDKKSDNLFNKGKLDAESIQTIRNQQQVELDNISTQLKQMTSEQRIKAIEKYNLNKQFNESGDIISNTQTNSNNKPLISAETNIEAYTPSLVNTDLKLAPTTNAVSEASKSAKQIVTTLDNNMRVVITDANLDNGSKFDAFYDQDNRVVYLNNKSTITDIMKAVAVHEVTHSLEGTKQYNKFVDHIKSMFTTEQWNALLAEKMQQYQNVNQSLKQGEIGDVVAKREAETELIAEFAGELFSNEDSIRRIVNQNKNLATRIYEWIKEAVAKLTKKGQAKGEEYAFLRKAEKLYADALKKSVGGYSLSEYKQNIENRLKETKKIKADEKTNTETAYARYSLNTDSEGNKLSNEQIEFFKDSKIRVIKEGSPFGKIDSKGQLFPVYHGTNSNEFFEFDKNLTGTANDRGWYGSGFYFAFSKGEAGYYGKNVIEAYLNITKPFIFDKQLQEYDGVHGGDTDFDFGAFVLNLSEKFPNLAEQLKTNVILEWATDSKPAIRKNINFNELAKDIKKIYNSNRLQIVKSSNGDKIYYNYVLKDNLDDFDFDSKTKEFIRKNSTYNSWNAEYSLERNRITQQDYDKLMDLFEKFDDKFEQPKYSRFKYETKEIAEKARLSIAVDFVDDGIYKSIDKHMPEYYMEIIGDKFKSELIKQGYDGVIQTEYGDEVVAFNANQIKLTTNKNPSSNNDIRYSLSKNSEGQELTEKQIEFFKDSKVRDKNGNLLVVYHNSPNLFTIFDKNQIGSSTDYGAFGRGFYFGNTKWSNYGTYEYEVYLNIKNPFIIKGTDAAYNFRKEVLELAGKKEFDDITAKDMDLMTKKLIKEGYDGVIFEYGFDKTRNEYIAFEANQIKSIDNANPTLNEDVRFNLSDGEGDYKYSKGQISKYIAEHSKPKSYAKVDAEKVINTIVNNTLTFGDKYGEIANKTKNQVVDMFWHSLNTRDEGYRAKAVLDVADYLIENSVAESIYKSDADSENASYIINNLRPYLRKIDLTSLKGEIAHKYDTDKSVYARWGKRKGTVGMGADAIAQELSNNGIHIESTNDADIFFEIDQMYRDSLAQLKSKTKESLSKVGSTEEISQLRQTIARELLNAWDDVGKKTKFQTTIDKYTGRISTLKNALKEVKATNKITNQIIDIAREARDIVKRNYKESAGILKDDRVKAMMKIVSGFNRANSTIIAGDIRNKISQLSSVYTQNNLGQFSTDTEFGAINSDFDPNIRDAIDFLMNNKSTTLTSEELKALRIVSKGILHLYKNYDKMTYQGKLQEVSAVAESGMGVVERTAKMKSKNGVFSKMFDSVNKKLLINATDPLTAITSMEGYDSNGVITQSMLTVMEGDTNAQVAYAELMMPFEEFYKNNKKYRKRLNELVAINTDKGEIKITVNEAAALYGWAQREQSNIYIEGFKVTSKDGSSETYFITPTDIDSLYDSLTNADKNFIELARKMFNEQARDMKVKTDEQLKGYSVIEETNWYIPIKRDQSQIATELGSVKGYIQDFATADNMSFNKATVRGARGALRLQNMTSLVESHARGVSTYYGLAVPLKNFNKVWNKRILVGDKLVSIKEVVHDKIWSGGNEYLGKFFNDLQGVRKGGQNRLLNKMRGSYAKFQLAFNVGTVLKQTASYGMAYTYLDVGSLARGLAMKANIDTMFKYAPITKARMFDRSVVKAQGLIDKLGTASDAMTKPIQLMDNSVVHKLWNASQVQVQKDMGHKIGTEQNLVEAGKLLEKVVRETQSNSITSERSAMSRSDSFLVSSFTMFMSDAQKQFSRLYESVGKVNALKWRIKNGESGLQQEYKQARKKLNRSLTGVTMSALIVAMVNKFMRWLLGREDKDNFWEGLGSDMIGQFFGLLPIVRDFYGYLTDDYEINNYALGMINDSADAIKGIWTVSEKLISGQYVAEHEINKPIRNLLYTFGQFTGIPFRNMYNLYYGVLDKFSPSEALKLKSLFYGNNGYSAALKDAVDKGDLKNADKIVALMLEDKTGKVRDDNVIETTRYLVSQGYNPMPKSLNKKITYNSEEINLTARQHAEFSKIYEQSNDVIKAMVNSSRFERLDDSAKARAMKMVYDYYYNLGLENLIGESLDNKAMLFASGISIDQLAMAVAQAQTYEANVDKLGNVITGSKKYKIQQFINSLKLSVAQKYMIMGYLGYSNKNGAGIVKAYINRLKLSKDEKQELYLMSGYKQ